MELAGAFPVELAAVDDDAAQRCAVAADEFGSRMDNDVCAVLDRAEQVRSREGRVDDQRDLVVMSDLCDRFDVDQVGVGVAQRFNEDRLGVGLDGFRKVLDVVGVYEGRGDAELGEGVCEEVIGSAVDRLSGNDVVAGLSKCLEGVGDGGCSGSDSQSANAAFEGCDSSFKDVLSRVGQTAVDIACVSKTETGCGVLKSLAEIKALWYTMFIT